MEDLYEQQKECGWYKRRHKKDGHTYRKNTSIAKTRKEAGGKPNCCWPVNDDKFGENPNHDPLVHFALTKHVQTLNQEGLMHEIKPVHHSTNGYLPRQQFGNGDRRRDGNDHKHGPKAELQFDKPRQRAQYVRWREIRYYTANTELKAYLNDGPDPEEFITEVPCCDDGCDSCGDSRFQETAEEIEYGKVEVPKGPVNVPLVNLLRPLVISD